MRQSMPLNDVTNRFGVHAINLRTQNRTLWDSKAKLLISGHSVFNNYTLYPAGEIIPEPIKCIASYAVNITQSGEHNLRSIVSNATERSNISKIDDEPASNADKNVILNLNQSSFCRMFISVRRLQRIKHTIFD